MPKKSSKQNFDLLIWTWYWIEILLLRSIQLILHRQILLRFFHEKLIETYKCWKRQTSQNCKRSYDMCNYYEIRKDVAFQIRFYKAYKPSVNENIEKAGYSDFAKFLIKEDWFDCLGLRLSILYCFTYFCWFIYGFFYFALMSLISCWI